MFDSFIVLARKMQTDQMDDFVYLSIDPGLSNIGWCVVTFKEFKVISFGRLTMNLEKDQYGVDVRIKKIYEYIEALIIKYDIKIVCIEKISFSSGRFSFAENSLLKAIGIISASIMCNNCELFEINNRKAQSFLLDKARSLNKQLIFEYVQKLIDNKVTNADKKKIFTKSKNDICDSFFIAYAFREIVKKQEF